MKLQRLFILLFVLTLTAQITTAQTKRALIFAIGNYHRADGKGWPQISSLNDVKYVKAALAKQGFMAANVKTVQDAQATVAGMTAALDDLIRTVKPNDVVVIHISSHGEQVQDDNGDEADGLDETIVAYDAVLPSRSTNFKVDQVNYLRDDVFGAKINQLRAALGKDGDVLVFMDCCHSGSGTRGAAIGKPRGNQAPFTESGFAAKARTGKEEVFKEQIAARGDEAALATYIVISAAKAEQLNYETFDDANVGMGSLTYAISKTFEQLDPKATYRSLFAKINTIMQDKVPAQQPVMEGTGTDRSLFGGRYINQKPYVEIEYASSTDLKLRSGLFAGLDSGAVVAIYPSGTTDTAGKKPLALGTVYKATNYAAYVKPDKDPKLEQAASGWVFLKTPIYKFKPVVVQVDPAKARGSVAAKTFSATEKDAIVAQFKQMPLVDFAGTNPDLILVKGTAADSIFIAGNGYLYQAVPNSGNNAADIRAKIEAYVQYKYLQNIIVSDEDAKLQVKLVPFVNGKADTLNADGKFVNGKYEFTEGDKFVLWVKNTGTQPVYFNILDMQPDGKINRVLPNKGKGIYPTDLKVMPNASKLYAQYPITLSPPYGTEIFKVFVSKTEIDMENIATTRGANSKGNMSVFEKLMKKSYESTRGAESDNMSAADGSSYNLLFEINKKPMP